MIRIILLLVGGYLLGSIPFGYMIGRLQGVDITAQGSGNIGATNAFRVLGPVMGLLVLVCDLLKGLIPALLGKVFFGPGMGVLAGLLAVAGHNWSLFLGLRGGRGAATGAGVLLALVPTVLLMDAAIWVLVILITGYVSLGTIVGAMAIPLLAILMHTPLVYYLFLIPAPVLVILRHSSNIRRLQQGTESKIHLW